MKVIKILKVFLIRNSDVVQFALQPLLCSCIQWGRVTRPNKGRILPSVALHLSVKAGAPCHANFTFTRRRHGGATIISGVEEIKLQQTRGSGHNS